MRLVCLFGAVYLGWDSWHMDPYFNLKIKQN